MKRRKKRKGVHNYRIRQDKLSRLVRTVDGYLCGSTEEARRFQMLRILERAGEIVDLEYQPKVELTRARVGYTPDFRYMEDGREVYEEYKGIGGGRWGVIKQLWRSYGPAMLRITQFDRRGRLVVKQEIMPGKL